MQLSHKQVIATCTGSLALVLAAPALAQESVQPDKDAAPEESVQPDKDAAPEIVVTALKQNQALEKVPATVNVLDSKTLTGLNIAEARDLNGRVPGFYFAPGPAGDAQMTIRGLGTNTSNVSFELSIGAFLDGVYAGHPKDFNMAIFDLSQVEIIKGTQSTLLGKNTSMGAVSFVTRKPGDDFHYNGTLTYTFDPNAIRFEGGVDIPLGDTLSVRLAGVYNDDDGYLRDRLTNETASTRQKNFRGTLRWKPSSDFDATLTYQRDYLSRKGFMLEVVSDTPEGLIAATAPASLRPTPVTIWNRRAVDTPVNGADPGGGGGNPGFEVVANGVTDFGLVSVPADFYSKGIYQRGKAWNNEVAGNIQQGNRVTLGMNYALPGGQTLSSTTGWFEWSDSYMTNATFGPTSNFIFYQPQESNTFSQEVRVSSPSSDKISYIVGALYYHNRFLQYNHQRFSPPNLAPNDAEQRYIENSNTVSVFGQLSVRPIDGLTVTGSLRYTNMTKSADFYRHSFTPTAVGNFRGGSPLLEIPLGTKRELHESDWDPTFTISYNFAPSMMIYGYIGRGSKAGGFQAAPAITAAAAATAFCGGNILCSVEYKGETTTTYEIGTKLRFGSVYFSLAAFQANVNDFQFTQVQATPLPATITNLDLRSRGFDAAASWRVAPGFTLNGGLNYSKVINLRPGPSTNPTFPPGTFFPEEQPRNPHWTGTFSADFTTALTGPIDLELFALLTYKSENFLQPPTATNRLLIPISNAATKIDLSAALHNRDAGVKLAFLVKNLLDERPLTFAAATSIGGLPYLAALGTIDPPRTFAIQLSISR